MVLFTLRTRRLQVLALQVLGLYAVVVRRWSGQRQVGWIDRIGNGLSGRRISSTIERIERIRQSALQPRTSERGRRNGSEQEKLAEHVVRDCRALGEAVPFFGPVLRAVIVGG